MADLGGRAQLGPGRSALDAVDIECAVPDEDALVAVDGELFGGLLAVEGQG